MDIETELRQLELMAPRHDNLYAHILDWMKTAVDDAVAEAVCDAEHDWNVEKDALDAEIEDLKDDIGDKDKEIEALEDELYDKNAEIDRLVALIDTLESQSVVVDSLGGEA